MKLPLLVFLALNSLVAADSPAQIYYSKSFPGSVPAFVAITIDESGAVEYKEDPADQNPGRFQLKPNDAAEIFSLAQKLDRFARPLESPAKVANMGMKTFRYEKGEEKHEVKFNFSQDPDARLLSDWFEKITETEQCMDTLDRAVKHDKLGVNKAILEFEMSLDKKRIVAPEQFLPMLDRVAKNESYLHMARARAAFLADLIRAPK